MKTQLRADLDSMALDELSDLFGETSAATKGELIRRIFSESTEEELVSLYADFFGHGPAY